MSELVSSVSTMLHCQMMRDLDRSSSGANNSNNGKAAVNNGSKMLPFFNEENYTGKLIKDIPAVKSIYQVNKQQQQHQQLLLYIAISFYHRC